MFAREQSLSVEHAAGRVSAYVYGNILVLAALVPVTRSQETLGVAVVLGAALSTFVAHAFAEVVGQNIRTGEKLDRAQRLAELRDGVPILSSAFMPIAILSTAWLGWLEPRTAQLVAEAVMVCRIASISYVISRLRGDPVRWHTHLAAFVLAFVAALVVLLKILLTH
ncbi:hypothetical protein [Rhodococcus sp. NPDC058521]|uniref:hypothetical protein n=1 Tax=Rhodococcus sp. NPDC058521 TaxID=3346536 RepID=UPI0036582C52